MSRAQSPLKRNEQVRDASLAKWVLSSGSRPRETRILLLNQIASPNKAVNKNNF